MNDFNQGKGISESLIFSFSKSRKARIKIAQVLESEVVTSFALMFLGMIILLVLGEIYYGEIIRVFFWAIGFVLLASLTSLFFGLGKVKCHLGAFEFLEIDEQIDENKFTLWVSERKKLLRIAVLIIIGLFIATAIAIRFL